MKIGTIDLSNARVGSSLATLYIGQTQVWPVSHDDVNINYVQLQESGQYIDLGVDIYNTVNDHYYAIGNDRGIGIESVVKYTDPSTNSYIWHAAVNGTYTEVLQKIESGQTRNRFWGAWPATTYTSVVDNTLFTTKLGIKEFKTSTEGVDTANNGEAYAWNSSENTLYHAQNLTRTASTHLSDQNIQLTGRNIEIHEFNIYNGPIINSDGTWKSDYTRLYHYVPVLHYVEGTGYVPCLKGTNWQTADVNYYYPNTGTLIYG